jgi:hypothetical protein
MRFMQSGARRAAAVDCAACDALSASSKARHSDCGYESDSIRIPNASQALEHFHNILGRELKAVTGDADGINAVIEEVRS